VIGNIPVGIMGIRLRADATAEMMAPATRRR
jgi:hypothetical protein